MSMLDKFGISSSTVADQFHGCVLGRTLIMDADDAAYAASATAKKLDTAQRRFVTEVLQAMFLTGAEFARVHLTPKGCYKNGRHLLLGEKPYQGNRKGKMKPPLLEQVRDTAHTLFGDHPNVDVFQHYDIEADDACVMDAYTVENPVLWSKDKDLCLAPCTRYCTETGRFLVLPKGDRFGYITERYTESGKMKVTGHGTKFFWVQMLMGDTADNIRGVKSYKGKLCGETTALGLLRDIPTEDATANFVLDAYRAIDQNPLPEAEALWLLRVPGDSGSGYIWSLNLSEANRAFVLDCFNRKWKLTDEEWQHELQGKSE